MADQHAILDAAARPAASAAPRRLRFPCNGCRDRRATGWSGHSRCGHRPTPGHRVASQSFCGKSRHISMQPSPSCRNTSVVRSRPSGCAGAMARTRRRRSPRSMKESRRHPVDVSGGRRREKAPIAAGNTVRNSSGASSMPPTTTMASGRCTCDADGGRESGRQQTGAGRHAGHQHRPHLQLAGLAQGGAALHARLDQPVEAAHHHDAVHGGDAEQRHEADGGRDAERHVAEPQPHYAADQRQRNGAARRAACRRASRSSDRAAAGSGRWRSALRSTGARPRSGSWRNRRPIRGGSRSAATTVSATFCWASSTAPPRSRSRTLNLTGI